MSRSILHLSFMYLLSLHFCNWPVKAQQCVEFLSWDSEIFDGVIFYFLHLFCFILFYFRSRFVMGARDCWMGFSTRASEFFHSRPFLVDSICLFELSPFSETMNFCLVFCVAFSSRSQTEYHAVLVMAQYWGRPGSLDQPP